MNIRAIEGMRLDAVKETDYLHAGSYEKEDQGEPVHRSQPSGSMSLDEPSVRNEGA